MKTLSVIIPVYNEEKYLQKFLLEQINQLKTLGVSFEVIISENGSKDKTLDLAKKFAQRRPYIKVISAATANYGLAVKQGFLAAKGKYLVLHDLDYWDILFLKKSLKKMKTYDAVVAAKRGEGANDTRTLPRKIITNGFSLLLKSLFGMKISDTHGIKILNRQKFLPLINKCISTKEIFDSELLIRGEYEKLKIDEIGITVRERRMSRTSILKRAIKTVRDLVYLKLKFIQEYTLNRNNLKQLISSIWPLAGLLGIGLLILTPSLKVPFSLIDDGVIVERSHWITDALKSFNFSSLKWLLFETDTGRSRPFYWLSLYGRFLIVGNSARGFHIFNILIVLGILLFSYLLIKKLTASPILALFGTLPTLLFYRTMENFYRLGPQEPLMLLLILISLYLMSSTTISKKRLIAAILLMFAAILTKETTIFIIPFLFIITIFTKNKRPWMVLLITTSIAGLFIVSSHFFNSSHTDYASNYSVSLQTLISSLRQYKLYFDSAYITPLLALALSSFVTRLILKDKSVVISAIGLLWFICAIGMLLPWQMAYGRYLTPIMPGLGLFLASEAAAQMRLIKRSPITLVILFPVITYYWANFFFVNSIQSINVINSHLAREVAAAQMMQDFAKYSAPNENIYFNFPYDQNNLEWIDGTKRHLTYSYARPDLSTGLIGQQLPDNGLVTNWSFVSPLFSEQELKVHNYHLVDQISLSAPQYDPILKNTLKKIITRQPITPMWSETFTWKIYNQL